MRRSWTTRSVTVLALTVALALSLLAPAGAREPEPDLETQLVQLTNRERTSRGLPALQVELQLTRIARDWSDQMAGRGQLSHRPDLAGEISGSWRRVGENVGVGSSVERIHQAFMASSGHRANVLGDFDRIGVGIVQAGDRTWITVNFLEGSGDFPVFRDVVSNTHRDAIEDLFARATTLGCSRDRYCPGSAVTRAQMATFLARELGLSGRSEGFRDVANGSTHAGAIGALAAAGITTGCSADRFCPEARVTRAQMASFLTRALDLRERAPSGVRDVPSSHTHAGSIGALQAAGITQGCTSTRFCPTDAVTRGQMASFLQRAFD